MLKTTKKKYSKCSLANSDCKANILVVADYDRTKKEQQQKESLHFIDPFCVAYKSKDWMK